MQHIKKAKWDRRSWMLQLTESGKTIEAVVKWRLNAFSELISFIIFLMHLLYLGAGFRAHSTQIIGELF
jgi:hypothetical protein